MLNRCYSTLQRLVLINFCNRLHTGKFLLKKNKRQKFCDMYKKQKLGVALCVQEYITHFNLQIIK